MRWIPIALIAFLSMLPSWAPALDDAEATTRFDEANLAYETEEFEKATQIYHSLIEDGRRSAALYFNLGNAHFQAGATGKAIASYKRALRLQPKHRDSRTNLRIALANLGDAEGADRTPPTHHSFLLQATLNQWTWGFTWPFLALCASLLLHAFAPNLRKRLGGLIGPLAALSLTTGILLGFANAEWDREWGVVHSTQTAARFGPLSESQMAFQLFEAAEVEILDRKDGWVRVITERNESGWAPASSIEIYTDLD